MDISYESYYILQLFSIDTFMVSVKFTGAIGVCKCSNLP